jgi:hypothetical protein
MIDVKGEVMILIGKLWKRSGFAKWSSIVAGRES